MRDRPDRHHAMLFAASITALSLGLSPDLAIAASPTAGLPWETPLQTLVDSLTGQTAFLIAILAFTGAAMALVFGGEINDFVRSLVKLVLVISMLLGAVQLVKTLFDAIRSGGQ